MTIVTDGLRQSPGVGIHELGISTGELLGAKAQEAVEHMPTTSILRLGELNAAQGIPLDPTGGMGGPIPPDYAELYAKPQRPDVSIDDARSRVKDEGLEQQLKLPEQPTMRADALDVMIDRAKQRRELETTLSRGPSGFIPNALGFGTSFFVGAVDPLNVATSFIPVIGEARLGKLMADAGESFVRRTGVRVMSGAAAGGAGAAMLEPLEGLARTQEGADYTMADGLRSIVYGAGFGAMFHTGGGVAADLVRRSRGRPLYPFARGEPGFDAEKGLFEFTPRERPATAPVEAAPGRIDERFAAPAEPEARPESRAQSLLQFIASRGGIRSDDPLIEDVRSAIGGKNHFIGGSGHLIRNPSERSAAGARGGAGEPMTLDQAREAAVEAGYLVDHGQEGGSVGTTTVRTLLDAIGGELRGRKVYAKGEEPAVDSAAVERGQDEEAARREDAHAQLAQALEDTGFKPGDVSQAERDRAVDLMVYDRVHDPLEAYERATWERSPSAATFGALQDLPPQAREDALRVSIAALHDGKPVPAAEVLAAAAGGSQRMSALSAAAREWPELPAGARFAGNGDHGPIIDGLQGRVKEALAWLRQAQAGDVSGLLNHPGVPGRIDLMWGEPFIPGQQGGKRQEGFGLAHMDTKHPGAADALPELWDGLKVSRAGDKFIELSSDKARAVVALDFAGEQKTWLLTFFERKPKEGDARPAEGPSPASAIGEPAGRSPAPPRLDNIADSQAARDATWHDLARRPEEFDEPAALEASQAAEKLPEPPSVSPEPNERIQAAERAAAAAEAEYRLAEAYLPDDLRQEVADRIAAIDAEVKDRSEILQRGAACLSSLAMVV